jgi:folate-binding protein YgfZ
MSMAEGRIAQLSRRGIVAVGGTDARRFLNDLITSDIERAGTNGAVYGGLLTPQGKILFDFIVFAEGERLLFDLPRSLAGDFVKRLTFYRLRAKVEIADLSESRAVLAAWGGAEPPAVAGAVAPDPRLAALGFRAILAPGAAMPPNCQAATEADYDAHRIRLGVPEGGKDFAFGEAFPHDGDMDQLGGVDFDKGCYVGQEVVSRMEHRGTARRRIVMAQAPALPPSGTAITAGDRPIGTLASVSGGTGLALVRLDRAKDAIDAGTPLKAGEAAVELSLPDWAKFGWPAAGGED